MAKGKRTDTETRVDITTMKLSNPDLSTRDIAEELGTAPRTTARIINEELAQIGTNEKAKELYDYNLEIILEGSRKISEAMKKLNPEDIRSTKEYQSIVDTAFKQNQLLS